MTRPSRRKRDHGIGLDAIRSDEEIAAEFNRRNPGARQNRKSAKQARLVAERKVRQALTNDPDIREMFALDREGNDQ